MFERELRELRKKDLLRGLMALESRQGPVVTIRGKRYINFASNDYLGLACHPEVVRAAEAAGKRFGFGAGASRLLAGGNTLHEKLEDMAASFKKTEAALVFNSGYAANTGLLPALAAGDAVIFSDELNHASIIDGCRLSNAAVRIYRHRDMGHLAELMKREPKRRQIVATDGVFSMDGDIAPLPDIYSLCLKHGAALWLDDAHATGVLGDGSGSLSHFGLGPAPWTVQMGTFSKALGSFGAFVAGSSDVVDWAVNSARSFMFSTALPPPVVAASIKALSLVVKRPAMRKRLRSNTLKAFESLREIGCDVVPGETPIIPLRHRTVGQALALSSYLWDRGIYAPAIRPPTVREPRVRITVTAAHTERHIRLLAEAIRKYGKRTGR